MQSPSGAASSTAQAVLCGGRCRCISLARLRALEISRAAARQAIRAERVPERMWATRNQSAAEVSARIVLACAAVGLTVSASIIGPGRRAAERLDGPREAATRCVADPASRVRQWPMSVEGPRLSACKRSFHLREVARLSQLAEG